MKSGFIKAICHFEVMQHYLVVTLEWLEVPDGVQASGLPHPLYCLPGGHYPGILHLGDRVQEQLEALLVVWRGEPGERSVITSHRVDRVNLCSESCVNIP